MSPCSDFFGNQSTYGPNPATNAAVEQVTTVQEAEAINDKATEPAVRAVVPSDFDKDSRYTTKFNHKTGLRK